MRDIVSKRLILRLLTRHALAATAAGDLDPVSRGLGVTMPPEWRQVAPLAAMRLEQLHTDPAYLAWSIRAILLRETHEVAGYVNFRGRPGRHDFTRTPDTVEFGYTIFPPFRRRGIAREAVAALIAWARPQQVRAGVFSIAPHNAASVAIAQFFGARKVGQQIDERDGPEDVYLAEFGP
jgi:RimJ/RimL family protein N-acetyltransferase